jgi:hypothetical protein
MLAGCIETNMLVRVKQDGSGTVEETVKMNKQIIEQLEKMKAGFTMAGEEAEVEGRTGEEGVDFDMFTEEEVAGQAERMGKGVRMLSYEEISTDTQQGYTAIFAFDDVNQLRVNQNPESAMPDMSGEEGGEAESKEEFVLFAFTPGSPARLEITTPTGQDDEEGEDDVDEMETGADADQDGEGSDGENSMDGIEMMKQFFRGMRLTVAVEVDGTIDETNATYVDGSRVTLIDFAFDTLLDNPEALKKFEAAGELGPAEAKTMMQGIPGIRFDVEEKIHVSFD